MNLNSEILKTIKKVGLKIRIEPESNYRAIFFEKRTIRQPIDPLKPIMELQYPEFYDIKITGHCSGNCPWCYMDSKPDNSHYPNALKNLHSFFDSMNENQKPFQVALGGGNPNEHPDFIKILKYFNSSGIIPNYTTNGMGLTNEILEATQKYCGGVAISAHPHLLHIWEPAINLLKTTKIKINLHFLISNKDSINYFLKFFRKYHQEIHYFVLLPYTVQGRATPKAIESDYLFETLKILGSSPLKQIAFGANFYEDLKTRDLDVSLYEPEMFSKFLDCKDMSLHPSSFNQYKWIQTTIRK
jgi:organic radical activating enzyme